MLDEIYDQGSPDIALNQAAGEINQPSFVGGEFPLTAADHARIHLAGGWSTKRDLDRATKYFEVNKRGENESRSQGSKEEPEADLVIRNGVGSINITPHGHCTFYNGSGIYYNLGPDYWSKIEITGGDGKVTVVDSPGPNRSFHYLS